MNVDYFTNQEFEAELEKLTWLLSHGLRVSSHPRAFLLGGQSGSGKTRLHSLCRSIIDDDVIIINGDEFRKHHPQFFEIQEQYGIDAPAHTAQWSGQMTEALIDTFSREGYNLVIEGTLRTSTVPLNTAKLLRERGYDVSLAIMAVKPEISLISCQIRYEMMRIAGTTPRATDPMHHNKIITDIVDNLDVLESSGLYDEVLIFDRSATQLYPAGKIDSKTASQALREVIFGPWTLDEKQHLESLEGQLETLRAQ